MFNSSFFYRTTLVAASEHCVDKNLHRSLIGLQSFLVSRHVKMHNIYFLNSIWKIHFSKQELKIIFFVTIISEKCNISGLKTKKN